MKTLRNKVPLLLLYLTGVFSLLGQFGRTQSPVGFISWYEVCMLASIFMAMPGLLRSLYPGLKKYFAVAAFILWALFITYMQSKAHQLPHLFTIGAAYLIRLSFYFVFAAAIGEFLKQKYLSRKDLTTATMVWLTFFAVLGIFQFLLQPDTRIFFYLGWDDHLSRAFATLFDPGYFGLLMVSGVLFVLWQAIKVKRYWHQILLALFLIATALSYSRASYVALCIGVLTLSFLAKSKRVLLVIPLLIVALVLLPKDGGGVGQNLLRTQTVAMRKEVAQTQTRETSSSQIIWGRGWSYQKAQNGAANSSLERQNSAGVDNIFLLVVLSSGLIGLSIFLLALIQLWKNSQNIFWKAFFLGALGHSFFSLGIIYPWVMLVLAVTFFLGEEPSSHNK